MSHLGHTEEKKQRGEDKKKKKEASKQKLEPKKKLQQTKEEKKEDKVNKKEVKKEPNKEEKEEVKKEPKKEGKRESDKKRLVRTDGVYCCLQAEGASSHRVLRFCADGKTVKYYGNITSHRELDGKHQYRVEGCWISINFNRGSPLLLLIGADSLVEFHQPSAAIQFAFVPAQKPLEYHTAYNTSAGRRMEFPSMESWSDPDSGNTGTLEVESHRKDGMLTAKGHSSMGQFKLYFCGALLGCQLQHDKNIVWNVPGHRY